MRTGDPAALSAETTAVAVVLVLPRSNALLGLVGSRLADTLLIAMDETKDKSALGAR
jgi:hypothetical protein